jgi:formate/nitrite transporter FocA (FNT family)
VGLTMNTLHGTELFTGNTMKLPAAIYEGKTNMGGLIKNWFWSYSGACGCYAVVVVAACFVVCTGAFMQLWLPRLVLFCCIRNHWF